MNLRDRMIVEAVLKELRIASELSSEMAVKAKIEDAVSKINAIQD